MAEPRPVRTKKLSTAITNPDNIADPALSSHKTAASVARTSLSQAVTQLLVPVDSDSEMESDDSNLRPPAAQQARKK